MSNAAFLCLMGVYTDGARERIDETVELWKEHCLLEDGSLLWPGDHLWTADNVRDLRDRFRAQPMYGQPGSFEDKLNRQLSEALADVRRLASETLVTYNLFVGWILLPDTKREMAERTDAPATTAPRSSSRSTAGSAAAPPNHRPCRRTPPLRIQMSHPRREHQTRIARPAGPPISRASSLRTHRNNVASDPDG